MDKKPLIGVSICAVVLLVLGSLSNVVGYQSVKSSAMSESPLFSMRTQKAINQQQKIITSQYLGKGKSCNLLSLQRPDETDLLIKIISVIQAMNDVIFERFVRIAVEQFSKQGKLKDITPQQFIRGLHQIRENSQTSMENKGSDYGSLTWDSTPTVCWFPLCFVISILVSIYLFLEPILLIIGEIRDCIFESPPHTIV